MGREIFKPQASAQISATMKYRTNVIWQRQKAALLGLAEKGTAGAGSAQANTPTSPTLFPPGTRTWRNFLPGEGAVLEGYDLKVERGDGVGCERPPTFPGWSRALQ